MAEKSYRIIFHIDLNCFFAACHIHQNPTLKGKPVIVSHDDPLHRGMVLTASYEARRYGIYTTQLLRDALVLCPSLVRVDPDYYLYEAYSKKFFAYLRSITKKVEPMSIDEGFLDMTDVCDADALDVAKKMQNYILNVIGLPCSIGIAPNKFLAKMASDYKKPMGITVLRKRDVATMLWPLPIKSMIGVGKKSQIKMAELGIKTIGDFANFKDQSLLKKTFGPAMLEYFNERCYGNDNSVVEWENLDEVSRMSNETTFEAAQTNERTIKQTLKYLCNTISKRLEEGHFAAQTIGVKIKYEDLRVFSRSRGLSKGINDSLDLWQICEELLDDNYDYVTPVRLIGVFVSRLINQETVITRYSIFDDFSNLEESKKIDSILDSVNRMYGEGTIKIGIDNNGKK